MKKLPKWIDLVLKGAGILNFFLAVGLVFFSDSILAVIQNGNSSATVFGLRMIHSTLWLQVAGIGFAVLGLGYFVASFNALRNSVSLFMGAFANTLGFIFLPVHFGLAVFTNWLLALTMVSMLGWVGVLVIMLYHISKVGQAPQTLAHTYSEPLSQNRA